MSRLRGNDGVGVDSAFVGMTDWGWISACAGNDGWWGGISACAGNDGVFFRVLGYGSMNSRVRGNCGMTDGGGGFPRARVMTECFFRVLGYGSMNSRVRGNCGFPPSRE